MPEKLIIYLKNNVLDVNILYAEGLNLIVLK